MRSLLLKTVASTAYENINKLFRVLDTTTLCTSAHTVSDIES
jgi:hypothetical protein